MGFYHHIQLFRTYLLWAVLTASPATSLADEINNLMNRLDSAPASGAAAASPANGRGIKKSKDPSVCNDKNNYLESQLKAYTADETKNHNLIWTRNTGDIIVNQKCIEHGLRQKTAGNRFKNCERGKNYKNADEVPNVPAPCLSETYVGFTGKSLNAAMNCMREVMVPDSLANISPDWKKKLENQQFNLALAMMRKESGYHVNAISYTKAAGGGQLTDQTIIDMNAETFDTKLKKELKRLRMPPERPRLNNIRFQKWDRSEKPNTKVCEAIISLALAADQPIKPGSEGYCGRISIENTNPFTNYVYAISYLRRSREIVENNLRKRGVSLDGVMTQAPLEKERLLTEFAVWGYNAGPGTIVNAFEKVLKNPSVNKNDSYGLRMKMKEEVAKEIERQHKSKNEKIDPTKRNPANEQKALLKSQKEHSEYLHSVLSEYEDMRGSTGECVTQ